MAENQITTVGWRERVDLPEWGVFDLIAKVDTGAHTSAIHVEGLTSPEPGIVQFDVVLSRKDALKRVSVSCPVVRQTVVRSSSGHESHRYIVTTPMRMKGVERVVELSLVARPHMIRRMLVGRQALIGTFIVDPSLPAPEPRHIK